MIQSQRLPCELPSTVSPNGAKHVECPLWVGCLKPPALQVVDYFCWKPWPTFLFGSRAILGMINHLVSFAILTTSSCQAASQSVQSSRSNSWPLREHYSPP